MTIEEMLKQLPDRLVIENIIYKRTPDKQTVTFDYDLFYDMRIFDVRITWENDKKRSIRVDEWRYDGDKKKNLVSEEESELTHEDKIIIDRIIQLLHSQIQDYLTWHSRLS